MGVHLGHAALNVTNLDVRIHNTYVACFGTRRCLSCNNRKLEGLSEFFLFEGNHRYNEQKKYKRDDKLSEQKKLLRFHILSYVHYVTTQTHEFKISDRIRKIERGISVIVPSSTMLLAVFSMDPPFCYLLMGDELGNNATYM